jgi:hypothetical protein
MASVDPVDSLGGRELSTATMAKKRGKAGPDAGGESPEPEARVRTGSIIVRGVPEWKEWAEELAEFDRTPSLNDLVDRALVHYARHVGFTKPAPKR